jgi:hypothetical protein
MLRKHHPCKKYCPFHQSNLTPNCDKKNKSWPQTVPKTVRIKVNSQVGGEGQHGIDCPSNGGEMGGICDFHSPTAKARRRGNIGHAEEETFGSERRAARWCQPSVIELRSGHEFKEPICLVASYISSCIRARLNYTTVSYGNTTLITTHVVGHIGVLFSGCKIRRD